MSEMQVQERTDFSGGMSRLSKQTQNQVYLLQNARPAADGEVIVRDGQVLIVSLGAELTTGSIKALLPYYSKGNGLHYYSVKDVEGSNDRVYDWNTELVGPPFGSSRYATTAFYKNTVFFSNGISAINYHTPITAYRPRPWGAESWGTSPWGDSSNAVRAEISGTPTPPVGSFIIMHKDRMYVGQSNGLVSYSNLGVFATLPTCDFPTLNFFQIGSSGDPVTGLAKGGDDLLVMFTSHNINLMTGAPNDDADPGDAAIEVINGVGVVASNSISSKGDMIAFLGSDRRPRIMTGSHLEDIDQNDFVREYFKAPGSAVLDAVSSHFFGDEIWWYVPKGNSRQDGNVLIYNINSKKWEAVFTNVKGYIFAYLEELNQILVASHTGGYIWQQDVGETDDGQLIPFELVSRSEPLGTLNKTKEYVLFSAVARMKHGDVLTYQYALDSNEQFNDMQSGYTTPSTVKPWTKEKWGASAWNSASISWVKSGVKWGANTWSDAGIKKVVARPHSTVNKHGYNVRLRVVGNVKGGTRFIGYRVEGKVDERDAEVL